MPLGTNHIITGEVSNFIPELWSDEVIAAYKSNLVAAGLVRKLSHKGKKGDTIRVPTPARGTASDKAAETQVTLIQHGSDAGLVISIDKHKEYSRLIEDIVDVQALSSLRRFYTDDGGYAIASQVDKDLLFEMLNKAGATIVGNASQSTVLDAGTTLPTVYEGDGTTWNETSTITDINDAGIRAFSRLLDVEDVPFMGRCMVINPYSKEDLLGIDRFTEEAFVGERGSSNTIRNGLIGDIYGMEVFMTNQLPIVQDSSAGDTARLNYVFHTDSTVLVEQLGVRSQTQYKQEYLADLYTTDMLYGVKNLRDASIVPFVTPVS